MALHLVDKDNLNRSQPTVNAADKLIEGSQSNLNTFSTHYRTPGTTNMSRVIVRNNVTITFDDQNRVSAVKGLLPQVANFPIEIVAQYGYDVFVDILGLPALGG